MPDNLFFCYHKRQYYSKSVSKAEYIQNNAAVLRFEIVSDIKLSVIPVFYCLDLVAFFKLSKYVNFVVSLLLIFSFFLWPPMPLQLVEEVFRTLGYFLCFSYLNRKIKTHSRTMANQNILFINVIVCY